MDRPELASKISSKVIHLFRLVSGFFEVNSEVVKTLFAQFMQFKSKWDVQGEEQTVEGSMFHLFPKEMDLDFESGQKLVAMVFLGEFGSSENYLDQLLNTIEVDDNSFTFLKFAIDRLQREIPSAGSGDSFEFSTTLVQSLEMIETVCKATYEEESKGAVTGSTASSDDKILKALTGWHKVEELLPFLHTIKNLKHEFILNLGIPAKCEELIIFIKTRGRGVTRSSSNEDKSKCTLEQVLFSLNSGTPSFVGMGLIELKKLIHQRNTGNLEFYD